jgi:hypothetical protein
MFFWTAAGGATAVVVGAFLPWITANAAFVGPIEVHGVDGDGKATLLLAGIVALIAVTRFRVDNRSRTTALVGILCSALVIAGAGWDFTQGRNSINATSDVLDGLGRVSFGSGLYLTVTAGVVMLIGCLHAERAARASLH